ncbi:hypothetical protein F4809DRAFT_637497 [Biscogniauxia mediterranea]|nr:hypothetical protein F4809DRAFT_637497 [Biscogniauxia mediterranea]
MGDDSDPHQVMDPRWCLSDSKEEHPDIEPQLATTRIVLLTYQSQEEITFPGWIALLALGLVADALGLVRRYTTAPRPGKVLVYNFTGMCLICIDSASAKRVAIPEVTMDGEALRPLDPGLLSGRREAVFIAWLRKGHGFYNQNSLLMRVTISIRTTRLKFATGVSTPDSSHLILCR